MGFNHDLFCCVFLIMMKYIFLNFRWRGIGWNNFLASLIFLLVFKNTVCKLNLNKAVKKKRSHFLSSGCLFPRFYLDLLFPSVVPGILSLGSRSNSLSSLWGFVLAREHWLVSFQSSQRSQAAPCSFRPYFWLLTVTLKYAKTLLVSVVIVKSAHYAFQGLSVLRTSKSPPIHTGLVPTCFGSHENALSLSFVINICGFLVLLSQLMCLFLCENWKLENCAVTIFPRVILTVQLQLCIQYKQMEAKQRKGFGGRLMCLSCYCFRTVSSCLVEAMVLCHREELACCKGLVRVLLVDEISFYGWE